MTSFLFAFAINYLTAELVVKFSYATGSNLLFWINSFVSIDETVVLMLVIHIKVKEGLHQHTFLLKYFFLNMQSVTFLPRLCLETVCMSGIRESQFQSCQKTQLSYFYPSWLNTQELISWYPVQSAQCKKTYFVCLMASYSPIIKNNFNILIS